MDRIDASELLRRTNPIQESQRAAAAVPPDTVVKLRLEDANPNEEAVRDIIYIWDIPHGWYDAQFFGFGPLYLEKHSIAGCGSCGTYLGVGRSVRGLGCPRCYWTGKLVQRKVPLRYRLTSWGDGARVVNEALTYSFSEASGTRARARLIERISVLAGSPLTGKGAQAWAEAFEGSIPVRLCIHPTVSSESHVDSDGKRKSGTGRFRYDVVGNPLPPPATVRVVLRAPTTPEGERMAWEEDVARRAAFLARLGRPRTGREEGATLDQTRTLSDLSMERPKIRRHHLG